TKTSTYKKAHKSTMIVRHTDIVLLCAFLYVEVLVSRTQAEKDFEARITTITDICQNALALPVWNLDQASIEALSNSLIKDRNVVKIEVYTLQNNNNELVYTAGNSSEEQNGRIAVNRNIPIAFKNQDIGYVVMYFTDYYAEQSINEGVTYKLCFISFLIIVLVAVISITAYIITKPVRKLRIEVDEIASGNLDRHIDIKSKDEIGDLADRINQMAMKLSDIIREKELAVESLKLSEEELREAGNNLEIKVEERTQELSALNEELQAMNEELLSTLETLRKTQLQLIHAEKMTGLGTLVAGVAHEINTPLGISFTAASYLEELWNDFKNSLLTGAVGRSTLETFIKKNEETMSVMLNNLKRAIQLVRNFKQVSVDESTDEKRKFNVSQYLESIIISLHPKLKKTGHKLVINCDESLEIDSYPGALAQILTNFIVNSLIHAYDEGETGTITIGVQKNGPELEMLYSDDGRGMAEEVRKRVFEPFFTTKRNEGGTGLGLHVVFNIVTLQLGGTIECSSEPGKGSTFIIKIPVSSETQYSFVE
ncbi:MAG: HAMP domain-containing protein, partial [Clostridiales bacterium]|nr:HAMP domain-containing protein [Clostridiales bacterium]